MLITKQTKMSKQWKSNGTLSLYLPTFFKMMCIVFFVTKEDLLKNVEDQTVSVHIDFHFILVQTVNVKGVQKK